MKITTAIMVFLFSVFILLTTNAFADKWEGYLELTAKPGTVRNYGQSDLMVPLLQDKNDLSFLNVRGLMDVDSDGREINIGAGHRHKFRNFIGGGYFFYDKRSSDTGFEYNQFTAGLEFLSNQWDFRSNFYLPENETNTVTASSSNQKLSSTSTSSSNVKLGSTKPGARSYQESTGDMSSAMVRHRFIRANSQIKTTTTTTNTKSKNKRFQNKVEQKPLKGFDVEAGYGFHAVPFFDELRLYAGGYFFPEDDGFESIKGGRARLEARLFDVPLLGNGSRLVAGVESQYDDARGFDASGIVSVRIPFGITGKSSKILVGLDRRMMEPVVRDVDIVTSQKESNKRSFFTSQNSVVTVKNVAIDPDTEEFETSAMFDWQGNEFDGGHVVNSHAELVAMDTSLTNTNDKYLIRLTGDVAGWTNKNINLRSGHTYTGDGAEFNFEYIDPVSNARKTGTMNVDQLGLFNLPNSNFVAQADTHLNGINSRGNGVSNLRNGYQGASSGKHLLSNSRITNFQRGAYVTGATKLKIINSELIGNGRSVYITQHTGKVESENNVFQGVDEGVYVYQGGIFSDRNSLFRGNNNDGRGLKLHQNGGGQNVVELDGTSFTNNSASIRIFGTNNQLTIANASFTLPNDKFGTAIWNKGVVSAGSFIKVSNSVFKRPDGGHFVVSERWGGRRGLDIILKDNVFHGGNCANAKCFWFTAGGIHRDSSGNVDENGVAITW